MEFETIERERCPVCAGLEGKELFSTYDDRYGQPDSFTVLECPQCETCYLREAIVPDQISTLYQKYYGYSASGPVSGKPATSPLLRLFSLVRRSPAGGAYEGWYGFWSRNGASGWPVKRRERVLDVGCGYGHLARHVLARGAYWTGLEVDANACQSIRNRGLECLSGTIETAEIPEGAFDSIIASQVIEHSVEPRQFMRSCARVLRKGGRLLLATPNAASRFRKRHRQDWIHWFVPYHQVLFTAQSLGRLGQACGLEMRACRTETPTSWALLQSNYRRPARGEKGKWLGGRTPAMLQPEWLSLSLRLADALQGSGDALIAELVKV